MNLHKKISDLPDKYVEILEDQKNEIEKMIIEHLDRNSHLPMNLLMNALALSVSSLFAHVLYMTEGTKENKIKVNEKAFENLKENTLIKLKQIEEYVDSLK